VPLSRWKIRPGRRRTTRSVGWSASIWFSMASTSALWRLYDDSMIPVAGQVSGTYSCFGPGA
jgi:hypothetical protein